MHQSTLVARSVWHRVLASWCPTRRSLEAFVAAFESQGYEVCPDGQFEPGFEKVALFVTLSDGGTMEPTHAAIQLGNGEWSSKLGPFEDIRHPDLESVSGPIYGHPTKFLRRKRR